MERTQFGTVRQAGPHSLYEWLKVHESFTLFTAKTRHLIPSFYWRSPSVQKAASSYKSRGTFLNFDCLSKIGFLGMTKITERVTFIHR